VSGASSLYAALALEAIESTAVPRLLRQRHAVVLERLAYGGGASRWFYVTGLNQLATLAETLAPGSALSFYFDDRIMQGPFDDDIAEQVIQFAADDGDAVLGRLRPEGLEILVDFVTNRPDLADLAKEFGPEEHVFYGRVPGRDNDSVNAVTLDLPDRDGVVRAHPH
jgi:hypothetical protein